MKKLFVFFIFVLFAAGVAQADEEIRFSALSVSGGSVSPGRQGIVLLELRAHNDGEEQYFLTGVTLRYTGTSSADIAVSSVKVFGSSGPGWVQYGGNQSFSGASCSFSGLGLGIASKESRRILITADCSAGAVAGHVIDADVGSLADLTVTAPFQSGDAPFHSLSPPYTVESRAVRMSVAGIPSSVTAGRSFSFVVSYVDSSGVVDPAVAGGTFRISSTAGEAPLGQEPQYSAGPIVSGQRICTVTLFRAETGRTITVSDSLYGSVTAGDITVNAAAPARITMDPIGGQTAGVPFVVTLRTADPYGNPSPMSAGQITTVDAASGISPSPGGQTSNLPVRHTWDSTENGRASVNVVIYGKSSAARLRTRDTSLEGSVSNAFAVHPGATAGYTLSAGDSIPLLTPVTINASARDAWGNTGGSYAGRALAECTDTRAEIPSSVTFSEGAARFTVSFRTGGVQTLALTDVSNAAIKGSILLNVNRPPVPSQFSMTVPDTVEGGKPFPCSVAALDSRRRVITAYNALVNLSTKEGAAVVPGSVLLSNGVWQGMIAIWGETFRATLCVSDDYVRSFSEDTIKVIVSGYEKTRVYPTVFTPRERAVHIRYFLKGDRDVTITVYNLLMEAVKEFRFPAGASGGREGLNMVEWDGRDGKGDKAHSGGYHIVIDKGYEKDRAGAVIKNY